MLERYLVDYCAPTLANLKTANLFNFTYHSQQELLENLSQWDAELAEKGISLMLLHRTQTNALIYVYRKAKLERDLNQRGVSSFLAKYGYEDYSSETALQRLQMRFSQHGEFPHEIGLFLGYPLGDVIGFIMNGGQNFKYTGYWKVYCNEVETVKQFAKFSKCREVYGRLFRQGRTVWQLTVAA